MSLRIWQMRSWIAQFLIRTRSCCHFCHLPNRASWIWLFCIECLSRVVILTLLLIHICVFCQSLLSIDQGEILVPWLLVSRWRAGTKLRTTLTIFMVVCVVYQSWRDLWFASECTLRSQTTLSCKYSGTVRYAWHDLVGCLFSSLGEGYSLIGTPSWVNVIWLTLLSLLMQSSSIRCHWSIIKYLLCQNDPDLKIINSLLILSIRI